MNAYLQATIAMLAVINPVVIWLNGAASVTGCGQKE
jgi:hypothetical protein